MSTRLDRLFLLLDTGSTPLIRKSAAEQLGDVVRLHPHELNTLLVKIHSLLRSPSWETRVAAAQAVDAICKNIPQWEHRGAPKSECNSTNYIGAGTVLFSQFDIKRVLECGSSLLGSEGDQYDISKTSIDLDDRDQLMQQRQQLNKRLGFDITGSLGIDTSNLFNDDDLRMNVDPSLPILNNNSKPVVELLKQQFGARCHLSSRERNVAKRKARSLSKQLSSNNNAADEPCQIKRIKRERSSGSVDSNDSSLAEENEDWPFQNFCEALMNDLFHSSWEVRHGAASGLREVIKTHGKGAGKAADIPSNQLSSINQLWLSDLALRLLCVLALDRFGDFVSDEVVAPVRETCAQALGVVLKYMEESSVVGVVNTSLQMLEQMQWEVRHGALLSIKYILAVKQDLTSKLLPGIFPAILKGLLDPDDDVRAVAAAALIPVTDQFIKCLPDQLSLILTYLWDILADLDDLTASTNSIMTLLAKLMTHPETKNSAFLTASLTELTPRLWPFFRHTIMSVRKAALETFQTLLNMRTEEMTCQWLIPIYQDAVRHIYQRSFLEEKAELLSLIVKVWTSLLRCANLEYLYSLAVPWLGVWLAFLMQPPRLAYDPSLLIEAKHKPRENKVKFQSEIRHVVQDDKSFIGGSDVSSENSTEKDAAIYRARVCGAKLFGMLAAQLCVPQLNVPAGQENPSVVLGKLIIFHLNGKSAVQRFVIGQATYYWAISSEPCPCPQEVSTKLLTCLNELIYFDEIAVSFTRMQNDCQDFLASLKQQGINLDTTYPHRQLLTLEAALNLTTVTYSHIRTSLKPHMLTKFDERQKQLHNMVILTSQDQQLYSIRVLCSLAMAIVALNALPEKLNPVIRPLMDVLKKEENEALQEEAALCLTQLIKVCVVRNPSPNSKIVKNLCGFLCADPSCTPNISCPLPSTYSTFTTNDTSGLEVSCTMHRGILTLSNLQKINEQSFKKKKGRPALVIKNEMESSCVDLEMTVERRELLEQQKQLMTQRQGAEIALTILCKTFNTSLPEQLPSLWSACLDSFKQFENLTKAEPTSKDVEINLMQDLVNNLQTMETCIPALHSNLLPHLLDQLETMSTYLSHTTTAVRHLVSRVLAALSLRCTHRTMHFVISHVLPLLGAMDDENKREGGTEAIANIMESLGIDCLPYVVVLVIPILGRMSDPAQSIRLMATHCFATLVRLMPLEAGIPDPPSSENWFVERKERERKFLEQLFDTSKIENFKVLIPVNAELRKYQQDGINWLGFLNKYKLHGILCDDMGLGKTLQSICVVATAHLERENKYKENQDPSCSPLPSIVVCPPTLVGHWVYEVNKFVDPIYLNPLMYVGPPAERMRLQKKVPKHNLIIASYDVVRNDIDFFSALRWNYCILDEGHIIRNGKTKLAKATKQLICNHRLILSGTPIQNNVLDLWSLFDFLMPGFLGTEKQFQAKYGRPILQSREGKSTSKEQEAGALAMEALHRQVLPFILRRLKEDVLQDLPPKIMQDYFCDLSPLQVELYEDFAKSMAKRNVDDTLTNSDDSSDKKASSQGTTHIFQALQYLRKVCNHPALVLNQPHPKYKDIMTTLQQQGTSLHDLSHAPKLTALKQLLNDCGIGLTNGTAVSSSGQAGLDSTPVVNQHRVLLFCQLKSMLDIVEKDLLKSQMPGVTFLRLDGTVPAGCRQDIVHRFNNDPSIDILLLTTHVGGLGLNLTGADTVIFVEHDWNPMKDLQAMDRAHRIGQKKVVNVYRLITRGTLEEKIMGLQKFKMAVANTVITQENSSLQTMGTEQLLDLFVLDNSKKGHGAGASDNDKKMPKKDNVKSILEGLEELWDVSQYEDEYNMDTFMKSLGH